jgi:hypothetical protein
VASVVDEGRHAERNSASQDRCPERVDESSEYQADKDTHQNAVDDRDHARHGEEGLPATALDALLPHRCFRIVFGHWDSQVVGEARPEVQIGSGEGG